MTISRLADDPTLTVPRFFMHPVQDPIKSKEIGRPFLVDVPHVEIALAANKQSRPVFPANSIWRTEVRRTDYGEEVVEVTYAMRFQKQYDEFVRGDKQSISGTHLSEAPFLTSAQRLNLKGLNIHTVEALSMIDGPSIKMLGAEGRDLKNQAAAYLEKAKQGVDVLQLSDALSLRDSKIEELQRQLASLLPSTAEQTPVATATENAVVTDDVFKDFNDEDSTLR